jgi:hypothetical protein
MTVLDLANNHLGKLVGATPEGIIALANAIPDMRALTSLNMSKNGLLSKEGGTVLGEMLKGNTLLKELDVSSSGVGMAPSKTDGSGFAKELAVGIRDNGALIKLDISSNIIGAEQEMDLQRICVASGIELAK